jgi:hypothetical protein
MLIGLPGDLADPLRDSPWRLEAPSSIGGLNTDWTSTFFETCCSPSETISAGEAIDLPQSCCLGVVCHPVHAYFVRRWLNLGSLHLETRDYFGGATTRVRESRPKPVTLLAYHIINRQPSPHNDYGPSCDSFLTAGR